MNAKHFLVIAMLGLAACQTGYFDIKEGVTPTDELNQRLLKDVTTSIQANFLPAKTRFYFPHSKEKLAEALENSLRTYGYAISSESKSREKSDIQLAYQLSEIEKGLFVLRVSIGEDLQMNRLYSEAKDGEFTAAGPLLMRKG